MINDIEEISWAYLLDPCFELVNSAGKPLTGGYIEVYIHGTRNKYYCASDFNGTLHPFQIPLDSLGSNIVLASPDNAYDVYVYNKFGNLVMSRYNVVPVGAGSGSGNSNFTIDSTDGTVVVTTSTDPETGVKTYDLSVPSVSGDASYWMGRGAATMGVNIEDTEYHDIQISSNSIRNEGEDIEVLDGKFSLKEGVYFWSVTVQLDKFESFDNTRQKVYVESTYNRGVYTMDMTHDESETVTFSGITVADHDGDTEGFKIKSEGTSPIRATLYHVAIHKLNHNIIGEGAQGKTYTGGDYIQITDDDVINVTGLPNVEEVEDMIEAAITATASGYVYTAGDYISIDNREISVTGLQPEGDYLTQEDLEGYATETYVDNSVTAFVDGDTVSSIVTNMVTAMLPPELPLVAGDGITITETEDHIEIAANVTSIEGYATESYVTAYVDNSISDFTTHNEVHEAIVTAIQTATGAIPDQLEAGEYISIVDNKINVTGLQEAGDYATNTEVYEAIVTGVQAATSEIPDVSDFATHAEVNESAVTSIQLVTGLIPDVSDFTTHSEVYESTVTAIEAATAVIPDTEEVQFEEINLSDYALATAIPVVTGYATHTEVHDATVTAIETVTAIIPEAQVQSDWTEDDTESPAYIQNKPDESLLVAGNGIEITESDNTIVISANVTSIDGYAKIEDVYDATVTAVQTATGLIPDVSDFTTHAEVYDTAVTAIQLVTGMIPDDYTTHTEVHEATVTAIEAATAAIPDTEEVQFEELDITQFAMASAVTGFATEVDLIEAVSAVTGIGDYGQFYATDITGAATMSKAKGTIDVTNDGKIMLKQGQSYHVTVRGRYVQGTAANTYTSVSYIEYVTNNSINFNVDKTKTESQYFELSYDLYKLNSDTNYYIFFTGVDGLIKDLFIEIHAIGSVGVGQGGGGGAEYDAGWGIRILNNVISVNPDIVATVTGVEALIQNVTATIPSAQVQSDWTEDDSSDPSYIQNKPAEKQLLAGANVTITSTATSVIISSTGGGSGDVTEAMLYDATVTAVQAATGLIPDVSDFATDADVYDAVVTGVQAATGNISTYTAGNGIDITNDVISVDDTVAMVSALPTTELGKFTIQSNVSGGPIEVICPTDRGFPIETVILDNTAVSGSTGSGTSSVYIVYKSPGYDDDYYSTEGSAILHIPEAVTGLAQIQIVYAPNSNPVSYNGPAFTNPSYIYADSTGGRYVLDAGDYDLNIISNVVPQSPGGYGKYITLYAAGPAPDVQALLKSSVSLAVRHPELGITVNLDRYTLGNTNTITNTSSYPQAAVYTDPTSKKQSVYLPSSAPYQWNLKTAVIFQYGSSSFGYSNADTSHDYIAYKYNSTTRNYEFAELVQTDYNAKKFTFARTYNGAIEYWIADCTNGYYSAVWTTETIDMSEYIPYSASGVSLPNSKFEIDTEGQAYKLRAANTDVINSTNWNSWFACLQSANNTYWPKGTYEININPNISFTDGNDNPKTADKLRIGWNNGSTWTDYITVDISNNKAIWYNPSDFTYTDSSAGYFIFMAYNGSIRLYGGSTSNLPFTSILYESFIPEEYLTVGDLELNGDNQVTAIDGHALAGNGGTTYTAGQYVSIDSNDVISVTGLQVAGNYATTSDISDMATKTWVGNQGYLTSIPSSYATDAEVYEATVTAVQVATGAIPAQVQSDWTEDDNTDPSYIQNKPDVLDIVAGEGITITETVTSLVINAEGKNYTAGQYIAIDSNDVISVTGVATDAEIYEASVTAVQMATGAIPAQVQSDWSVTATGSPAYIQNKPEVIEMEILPVSAGDGISIETSATGIVISAIGGSTGGVTEAQVYDATVTAVQTATGAIPDVSDFITEEQVTALIPDTEEVQFEELDVAQFAMASAIPDVTSLASKTEVYDATVTAVQTATGLIPDVSDFVTDTEVTTEITEAVSGKQDLLTGITDVQVVTGLPVSPTQDVLYLIVEA